MKLTNVTDVMIYLKTHVQQPEYRYRLYVLTTEGWSLSESSLYLSALDIRRLILNDPKAVSAMIVGWKNGYWEIIENVSTHEYLAELRFNILKIEGRYR